MSFISNYFEIDLPQILVDNKAELKNNGLKYKIVVDGEGSWMLDLSSDPPSVYTTEEWGHAQCELSAEDAELIIKSPERGPELYMKGRVKVKGDSIIFRNFDRILRLKRKE